MTNREGKGKGRPELVVGITLNVLLILVIGSVLLDLMPSDIESRGLAHGALTPREPASAAGMALDSPEEALASANDQLDGMGTGNIQTINDEDPDYRAACYRDWKRGNVVYWELEDSNTTVLIKAEDEEIIYYEHTGWVTGSLSENQILTQAATIAGQFDSLPADREDPEADFYPEMVNLVSYDEDAHDFSTVGRSYWEVIYNRSKDGIVAEDHIQLLVLPNGYCSLYSKTWNMTLASLSTSYSVSQSEAEDAAEDFIGGGAVAHKSFKMIVRPNNMWISDDVEYGNPPVCVWVVWVEDDDGNLCIVHVNGNTEAIEGGDFAAAYYI